MKRFLRENINTGDEYDVIFVERKNKGIDNDDIRRWNALLRYYKGGRLVDLGCLDSMIPIMVKKAFPKAEVWGLDHAAETIKYLQDTTKGINYVVGDVYDTKFPTEYFNYVVAGELMEHLEEPDRFLVEAFRILKKNGTLAVSVPFNETDAGEVDAEHHLWSFNKEDMAGLLGKYGSVKIKILGSHYFPYRYRFPVMVAFCKKA